MIKLKSLLNEMIWTDSDYGGIPSGGGFSSNTEYEIGLQLTLEAIHCILGSIERGLRKDGKIERHELEHAKEEMGIIERAVKEYSRPLYVTHGSPEYIAKTVKNLESIPDKMIPKIKSLVSSFKSKLEQQADPLVFKMGVLAYALAKSVYEASKQSVSNGRITQSAFRDSSIMLLSNHLKKTIEEIQPYEWEKATHVPAKT